MKRRRLFILSLTILLVTVVAVSGKKLMNFRNNNSSQFNPEPPSIYISTEENRCLNFEGADHWIYVHSPEDHSLIYVNIDIQIDCIYPSVPLVLPGEGVVVGAIDVSSSPYHIEAAWTPRSLEHEPIIRLRYLGNPMIDAFPYNITFQNSQGTNVVGTGIWSLSCCADPSGCWVDIAIPSHVYVLVGEQTIIPFQWYWECWATGGGQLNVSDTEGWVVSWAPSHAGGGPTFGLCVVPVYNGWVEVSLPASVPVGTTSQLLISGPGSASITLEADDGTPVESKTWGEIKSLYR